MTEMNLDTTVILEHVNEVAGMIMKQVIRKWEKYHNEKTAMKEEIASLKREITEIKGIPVDNGVTIEG